MKVTYQTTSGMTISNTMRIEEFLNSPAVDVLCRFNNCTGDVLLADYLPADFAVLDDDDVAASMIEEGCVMLAGDAEVVRSQFILTGVEVEDEDLDAVRALIANQVQGGDSLAA
jgi:hypothetical protein